MNEVLIDGVQYIPVTEATQIQIQKIREVLESQGFLSRSAIDEILKGIQPEPKTESKPKAKWKKYDNSTKKSFRYNSVHKHLFNIGRVLENGGIIYKKGRNPARWNIQQAMVIREHMNKDSTKGMSYSDVNAIEKKVKLSKNLIRKILYNIEYGDLTELIDKWRLKNLHEHNNRHNNKPLQNNPQKRKETGYGWVV